MKQVICNSRYFISLIVSILFFNFSFPVSQFIVNDKSETILNCLFISLVLTSGIFIITNNTLIWIVKMVKKGLKLLRIVKKDVL